MATIKSKTGIPDLIISNLHGKIGGLVIRQRNGKTIISPRPVDFKAPQDPESIARRYKFKIAGQFASLLYGIPLIKIIWKEKLKHGANARCSVIKHNYHFMEENLPTVDNTITPPGSHFDIAGELSEDGKLHLYITGVYEPCDRTMILAVLTEYDRISKRDELFVITDLTQESDPELTIQVDLSGSGRFRRYILYTAVVQQTEEQLKWSKTLAFAGEFSKMRTEDRGRKTLNH